jgi:multidrug resistance protein, MATE family
LFRFNQILSQRRKPFVQDKSVKESDLSKSSRSATEPVPEQFARLAAINILSNLLVPLAGLIDLAFLGHLSEIRHLAGVALATVLFNYIYWSFGFLRMGTTGITAQAVGRGDADEVLLIGLRHGLIALLIGWLILLLQWPLKTAGFWLLSATPEVKAAGVAFYDALIWGAPAALLGFVLIGWFLGQAEGSKVLLLTAVSSSANVVLDYWLIVERGWGSAGAGAATAISQYLVVIVGLGLVMREVKLERLLGIAPQLWELAALRKLFSLNGEIFLRLGIWNECAGGEYAAAASGDFCGLFHRRLGLCYREQRRIAVWPRPNARAKAAAEPIGQR